MRFADRRPILQAAPVAPADSPPAGAPRPADSWPAWTDEPAGWPTAPASAPAGPTRRAFLGAMLGAGAAVAAAGCGGVRAVASVVAPSPGPLERAHCRWMAAMDEVDLAAADDGRHAPYGSAECDRQERRLEDAQEAARDAREELLDLIGEAVGYDFPDPSERDLEAGVVLASAREGRHLFLVVVDDARTYGILDDSDDAWRRRSFRPAVAKGVFPC